MVSETLANYDFETDSIVPTYTLGLHVRNIKNDLLVKALSAGLKAKKDINVSKGETSSFIDTVENIDIPSRYFKVVNTAVGKLFTSARNLLESKHDITFITWHIEKCFFVRNVNDSSEWVLSVFYQGDYGDDD